MIKFKNDVWLEMSKNENPWGPSEAAIKAAFASLQTLARYPDSEYRHFKTTLANFYQLTPYHFTIANGSDALIKQLIETIAIPCKNAILAQYTFLPIVQLFKQYKVNIKVSPTRSWQVDVDNMLSLVDTHTQFIFLVNPSNPLGTYITHEQLKYLLSRVSPQILVVIDEAYAEYVLDTDFPKSTVLLNEYPNLMIIRTFSKAYGLAGLRIGYMMSAPQYHPIFNKNRLPYPVSELGIHAAIAALNDREHLNFCINETQKSLQQLKTCCDQLHLSYLPTHTNFLTLNIKNSKLVQPLLLKTKIIVKSLREYHLDSYIRVSTGTENQNKQFINCLSQLSQLS